MSNRTKQRILATVLGGPIIAALLVGSAGAATREADFYLRSAQRMIQNNDLKGAEVQLRNAAQRAPTDGTIRMQLAELYVQLGNVNAAEAELIAAKQRGVNSERHAMLLAEVMFRSGEFGQLLREVPAANRAPQVESLIRTYRGLSQLAIGQQTGTFDG